MNKGDLLYVQHILDAVVRELEIIGEAAGHLSESTQQRCASIPWSDIVGMRNRLIHEYFDVDFEVVWKTCHEDLPKLKKALQAIAR